MSLTQHAIAKYFVCSKHFATPSLGLVQNAPNWPMKLLSTRFSAV